MSACESFRKYLVACEKITEKSSDSFFDDSIEDILCTFDDLHQGHRESTGQNCLSQNERKEYDKVSVEEFHEDIIKNIKFFLENMKNLNTTNMSFPEWYETFGAWLEVGTDAENMYFGKI